MKLFYTPRSHFTRKVRILSKALQIDIELIDAGNAADSDPALFGPNPLMKVPTLVDGEQIVFESDHIAGYLVRRHDPADRFGVLTADADTLNARAVMNGVMAAEAELILAARTGIDTAAHRRFDKMRESVRNGLSWLDAHHGLFPSEPSYLTFHAVSMWDHLAYYGLFELHYPQLRAQVMRWADTPFIAESKPV
jgi:glutathione S-transferase